jgi:hypothetical protein
LKKWVILLRLPVKDYKKLPPCGSSFKKHPPCRINSGFFTTGPDGPKSGYVTVLEVLSSQNLEYLREFKTLFFNRGGKTPDRNGAGNLKNQAKKTISLKGGKP